MRVSSLGLRTTVSDEGFGIAMGLLVPAKRVETFRAPRRHLGEIDAVSVARLLTAAADIALVIDNKGIIRDVGLGSAELLRDGCADWLGKRWIETVSPDSRLKIEELLRDASSAALRYGAKSITPTAEAPICPSGIRRCRWGTTAKSSPSGGISERWRRCSSGWSMPSRPWSASTPGCGMPKRATGFCSRSRPSPCSLSTV